MTNNSRELIPIFFATDDNYAPFLLVAIESITSQASQDFDYAIHVLCENLSDYNINNLMQYNRGNTKVIITDMTDHIDSYKDRLHTRDYYSRTTYFRMFIPNMFPQYKKALYLDSDIALNGDIAELYNFDIGDNFVGGVTCEAVDSFEVYTNYAEKYLGFKLPWYFNAGVLLMNLEQMRKNHFEDRFFEILSKVTFTLIQDQDYLNVLCRGRVTFLPKVWNKIPLPKEGIDSNNVRLVHYNLHLRPWRYDNIPFEEIFWKHAKNSVAYETLLEMKRKFSQKDADYDNDWGQKLQESAREHAQRPNPFWKQIKDGEIVLEWYNG